MGEVQSREWQECAKPAHCLGWRGLDWTPGPRKHLKQKSDVIVVGLEKVTLAVEWGGD